MRGDSTLSDIARSQSLSHVPSGRLRVKGFDFTRSFGFCASSQSAHLPVFLFGKSF